MSYSVSVLKKYHDEMESLISWYATFPVESLEVCISSGNMKVGNVPNVSLPADWTCPNCATCTKDCYDKKACIQYLNVRKARARNYSILVRNYQLYWTQIRAKIAKLKTKFFRFHVAGDIISERYFSDMVKTARLFPHIRFWTYTKSFNIVNTFVRNNGGSRRKAIPENLSVMFSAWGTKPIDNPYGFPVFLVLVSGMKKPNGFMYCPSNCLWCIEHHTGCPYGVNCCIDVH